MDYANRARVWGAKALKYAKKILAPASCVQCVLYLQDQEAFFCKECEAGIKPLATTTLHVTDQYQATVYAVSDYKNPLKPLVLAKQSRQRLAAWQLGILLWEKTDLKYADFDYIVPVPLHWTRYAWRWFNQAEVMAQALSEKSGKPVLHLVKKVKQTSSQAGLSRVDRMKNIHEAFIIAADAYRYKNARLLFVDDVMTTGTTLKAVIKKCLIIKPQQLFVAVACRVV